MKSFKNYIPSFLYGFSFCILLLFLLQQGILFFSTDKDQKYNENILTFQKIEDMYNLILDTYYEPVDTAELLNSMLETMLNNVDFHTTYIPYQDHLRQSEEMSGNFYGIGIQFSLFKDTIVVVRVLPDGPAQSTPLLAGDRITHVDGKEITGPNIKNELVLNTLRGDKGTNVKLTILNSSKEIKEISLNRGEIPLHSISSSYFINPNIGYIKIDKFSSTTYSEFIDHTNNLINKGAEKLILDLRGNTGGYLDQAVAITEELLEKGLGIVSVKGQYRNEIIYKSNYNGQLSNFPLVVIIDEGSASASEILAGAIQDNGRGEIVGRPSFGKGLVGEEFSLGDGSVLRLTVARYFTPSGRCIQKEMENDYNYSYDTSNYEDYFLNNIDSTKIFKTLDGDTVFGGGGIYPDYFVQPEFMSNSVSSFFTENLDKIDELTFQFIDLNRARYSSTKEGFENLIIDNKNNLISMISSDLDEYDNFSNIEKDEIYLQLEVLTARNFLSTKEFVYFVNNNDSAYLKSINLLNSEL